LLDVNVLLAFFDAGHIHHDRARAWWRAHHATGWASCPLTQNGFVRIISRPGYPRPIPLSTAVSALATQVERSDHEFWPDDVSIADDGILDRRHILGPNQITDICLLALAVQRGGRLVTFDRGVPLRAVRGAEARHLVAVAL
jgi:toxin-antitoxin system PIN domain toxin